MPTLSKWYCDCVTESGQAFIGYHAHLRAGFLDIPYAATILGAGGGSAVQQTSFRKTPAPVLEESGLRWSSPSLGVKGVWVPDIQPCRRTLLASPGTSIVWRCHVPRARTRVEVGKETVLVGLGYAEQLFISQKKWRIPFSELLWGRFLSPGDVLVWIEWRGAAAAQWVFFNGADISDAAISGERIELPGVAALLEMQDLSVLRTGTLGEAVFPEHPFARRLFPSSLRDGEETKWLARGTLTRNGRKSTGWVIQELVRWP